MSASKKILLILFSIFMLLIAGGWMYYSSLKPSYSGELILSNIDQETEVYYDDFGIPHIYAQNQNDAMVALGYVHAQDRLWQMELMKRIAPGRLSAIFGKDLLKNDIFFKTLGIDESSEKAIENLNQNSEVYKLATAYLNGVNQYVAKGATPIEFTLIGIEKEQFTLKDIYNILGYMSFSFAMAHKTDPLLSEIHQKLGNDYIKDLNIEIDPNTTLIKNSNFNQNFVTEVQDILDKSPLPSFIGSNSWVVSSAKTETGSVLFANDPHIGFSQPAVWYEAHIVCPNFENYGYHIAGVPFPLLVHNRKFATGITMFENDDINFYQEELHPENKTKYKTPKGFKEFSTSTKTIKIKDADAVEIEIKNSNHGPIVNNVLDDFSQTNPVAMSWIYTQLEIKVLEALYTISRAQKMDDVKKGVQLIHAPGLNIMYGDAKGNIAWWAAGKLMEHQPHVNTKFILNGTTGEDEPLRYLNFEENPMAENPSWNYVYSANNQPDSINNRLYPGYYLPEDRAKRIVHLLEAKNNWKKEDFAAMLNDVTSSVSPEIITELINSVATNSFTNNEQNAINKLSQWNGSNTKNEVAPTIYNKFVYLYLKNTFQDELGEVLFNQLLNTHLMKRQIAYQIKNNNSVWWDDISTSNIIESKATILEKSLKETIASLELQFGKDISSWKWEKVHTLEHNHPLGTVESLKGYFNVGPFSVNGAREVINNSGYKYDETGEYKVISGPSTRRIIDFSDIENSISILPTGQSGNPLSKHYKDQAEMFNNGQFRKMKLNKTEIITSSTKLKILPKNE